MKRLTIFRLVRDPRDNDKILRKQTLRIITVHPVFVGIGEKGTVNKAEFKKLADALEPSNDGFSVS
jgi:hypothetical protein